MKKILIISFIAIVLIQLFVPIKMILDKEDISRNGKPFKFRTQPVDPNDYFRGKYINLSFIEERFPTVKAKNKFKEGETVFVLLKIDSAGYAKIASVSSDEPEDEKNDFVKAKVLWINNSSKEVVIEYPFNRFYMEETKAKDAEKLYRDSNIDSTQITYALVNIKNGKAVLKNVFINDKPIKDAVEEFQRKKKK